MTALSLATLLALRAHASGVTEPPSGYTVGPRDVLTIEVYDEPDLSGAFEVSTAGTIDFPLVGRVVVTGQTADAVGQGLREALGASYLVNPQVRVRVDTYASQQVQVIGAVARPGVLTLTGPTTLLEALSLVGGVKAETSAREVQLRRGTETRAMKLDAVMAGEESLVLEPGDVVVVPEGLLVFVAGEVVEAGSVAWRDGLTVTQALVQVGGPRGTARLKSAYILRDGERLPVDVRAVLKGRVDDVRLEAGDQLVLPESVF